MIAAATSSPTAIPVPDVVVTEPSMHFGDDIDFGRGWADDMAIGGAASAFGSTDSRSGGLEGFLFDLKQDRSGNKLPFDTAFGRQGDFVNPMLALQRANFSNEALRKYYQAPTPLYLNRVAIPPQTKADDAPKYFQAEKTVEPRGWFARYKGKVVVPRDGEYRFSGIGDDYLLVNVDGKPVLHGHFSHIWNSLRDGWERPQQPDKPGALHDERRASNIYGNWIQLRKGQVIDMEIIFGENTGGRFYAILQVEEKGVEYRKCERTGRSILPLFTTTLILPDEIKEIRHEFSRNTSNPEESGREYEFEFDFNKVPVFKLLD